MDLKHLKALETIKEGISIEVLNDLIGNREKYSGELLEILDYTVAMQRSYAKKEVLFSTSSQCIHWHILRKSELILV